MKLYIDNSVFADVAELVDAQVSEACSREGVEVRFFSSAPIFTTMMKAEMVFIFCFRGRVRWTI